MRAALMGVLILFYVLDGMAAQDASSALDDYINASDATTARTFIAQGRMKGISYMVWELTSQTWKGIAWKHQLIILKPKNTRHNGHALFVIAGGGWKEGEKFNNGKFAKKLKLCRAIANKMGTPVAIIKQIPFQPIFDGRREDAAIAYTFDTFLETGDKTWPLLLPMTKAAVKGMDAVQEIAKETWGSDIKEFTVTGASKRGWTTWLVGAVDDRATAIVPMVIDMLNTDEQMAYQKAVGGFSEKIKDYTDLDIPRRMIETERGKELLTIADPYEYRQRLCEKETTVMLGTNDPYWVVDSLNLYWDGLCGRKHVVYMPNQGHKSRDYGRVLKTLETVHRYGATGKVLPSLSWKFTKRDEGLTLALVSDTPIRSVRLWRADAESTQAFHTARWRSRVVGASTSIRVPMPESGCRAVYAEVSYTDGRMTRHQHKQSGGILRGFTLTTQIAVLGPRDQCLSAEMNGTEK